MPLPVVEGSAPGEVTAARVFRLWAPLAASWLLMATELPLFTAAVARLPEAEINLAAHGALVMPLSLIVEAPIIMLLAAATALCRDLQSYRLVFRFMLAAAGVLTLLHATIAFTPLFDVVVHVLGVPDAVVAPGRLGLQVMLPWTASIAYRRVHQGLLIRFGRSRPVALGTLVRLLANGGVLLGGTLHGGIPGIVVGAAGLSSGVIAEAAFIGACARHVVRGPLREAKALSAPLRLRAFLAFYVPLALTPLLSLAVPPLSAAALSRMPASLPSLAAWPAAFGFLFMIRSGGFALNEVVVSLLDERGGFAAVRKFTHRLAAATSLVLLVVALTPLGPAWLRGVSGLSPALARLARWALALAIFQPALTVFENWFQGRLVHARRTRDVTLGMGIYLSACATAYAVGVAVSPFAGIHYAIVSLTVASAAKTVWLATRARRARVIPDGA